MVLGTTSTPLVFPYWYSTSINKSHVIELATRGYPDAALKLHQRHPNLISISNSAQNCLKREEFCKNS